MLLELAAAKSPCQGRKGPTYGAFRSTLTLTVLLGTLVSLNGAVVAFSTAVTTFSTAVSEPPGGLSIGFRGRGPWSSACCR